MDAKALRRSGGEISRRSSPPIPTTISAGIRLGVGAPKSRALRSRDRRLPPLHAARAEHARCPTTASGCAWSRPVTRRARWRAQALRRDRRPRPESKVWIDHAAARDRGAVGGRPEPAGSAPAAESASGASRPRQPVVRRPAPAYVEAQLLRDRGRIDDAIAKFKQAIAARPAAHSAARTALGELLLKIRRDDEAIAVVARRRRQEPDLFARLVRPGVRVARRAAQHAAAVDAYEHYIKLKPGDPDPYYGLGRVRCSTWGAAADARARLRDLRVAGEAPGRTALDRIRRSADQDARSGREVAPDARRLPAAGPA